MRVPGAVTVPEASAAVEAFTKAPPSRSSRSDVTDVEVIEVEVDGEALGTSLVVRNWIAGDRMRPVGVNGRKKLQDIFVDAKVPRADRLRLPLVADEHDRVVWVPGHAVDRRLRATDRSKAVVVLRLTKQQALPVGGPE